MSSQTDQGISTQGRAWHLWFGFLGPPFLWLAQFEINYAFIPWMCKTGHRWPHYLISTLFLLLVIANGLLAHRIYKRTGEEAPSSADEGMLGTKRMIATIGLSFAAFFCLILIAQSLVFFVFDPCHE